MSTKHNPSKHIYRHLFYSTLVAFLFSSPLFSQEQIKHCGADEMRISTLKQNPKIAEAVIKRDAELEQYTKQFVQQTNSGNQLSKTTVTPPTYVIPVVFHVIHNYGTENISDAQLKDGLDMVNKTFRKTRSDTASVVQAFKSIHADCDIEFKLAQKDPNGNCHSGINRIASSLTNSGDHRVKNLIHWPPTKYLNIYVVVNAAGLAGHCVWPSDADTMPLWDGIVISHNYVGTIGTSNLMQSVAFAHECGHYLNLHHIWGGNNVPNFYFYPCADPNKDCNIDDLVADTPPTIGWQSCNLNGASCGNVVDNVQNAMDYSYCNMMFTQGQKARMQSCLNYTVAGRNNLWQPANLAATGVNALATLCQADFTNDKQVICPNTQVKFLNTSYNGTFTAVSWKFQGGTPSISSVNNPTVTYASPGTYSVELTVTNGTNTLTIAKQNVVHVQTPTASISYPFTENFESVSNLNGTAWYSNNIDTSSTWQLTTNSAYQGVKSALLNNFISTVNGKDELYSQPINLTGASTLNISFRYAFARRDTSNQDKLQLFTVQACNGTSIPRFTAIGSALETVPVKTTAFYPSSNFEWKQVSASLPSLLLINTFYFKFVFTRDGGNNLFIDDINIDINAGLTHLNEAVQLLDVFPNPASNNCSLKFNLTQTKTLSVNVYNVLGENVLTNGKRIYPEGENNIQLNTIHLTQGIYFIQLTDGKTMINKPLIISH